MKCTQFDAHNKNQITVELEGPAYHQTIVGSGYFIIVNPNSEYVSFSKKHAGVCFGDVTAEIIPNYTNQQYADEYGDRGTGLGFSVREFMRKNCRMTIADPVS